MSIRETICAECGRALHMTTAQPVMRIDEDYFCNDCGKKRRRKIYEDKVAVEYEAAIVQAKDLAVRLGQSVYISRVASGVGQFNIHQRYAFFLEHDPWFSCECVTVEGEVLGCEEYT